MNYVTVIGLEIHAELLTKSKIFCSCKNSFGGGANERICPICCGLPGSLPRLNKEAVKLAVLAGGALGCKINNYSAFDRKNYFYPDLPKAYQITQFEYPICGEGMTEAGNKSYRIERIHLEEDAGKLIHEGAVSKADYNRCGVPLIEIVTKPDFGSAEEVCEFVHETALRLKYAKVCDARLEQGSIRADVNISVMPEGASELGTRTEIKNLNSYKSIKKAIEYEAARQISVIKSGGRVKRETLRFDGEKTISMRTKEGADDYRYFPEPDILPVALSDEEIGEILKQLPKMPRERIFEYVRKGVPKTDAELIAEDREFCNYYEAAAVMSGNFRETAKLMLGSFSRELNAGDGAIPFEADKLAALVKLICENKISRNSASDIMTEMFKTCGEPEEIAQRGNMILEENKEETELAAKKVIKENPKAVADYKNGNKKSFGFLMGALMKSMPKSANPKTAKEILGALLEN